jgi:hypothetical protein
MGLVRKRRRRCDVAVCGAVNDDDDVEDYYP